MISAQYVDGLELRIGELNELATYLERQNQEQGKLLNAAIAERDNLLALTRTQENLPVPRLREQLKEECIQHKRWQMACAEAIMERDDYRVALEICKTEMQGDKWDALYIDTVLAKYPREEKS